MKNAILVIDDEQDFLDSVKRGLFHAGLRNIQLVSDPHQAAALIEQGSLFDVALIDITMPGIGGMEILDLIKNKSPDTECVMVTAVNEARVAMECLRRGAYDYLVKPISRDDLVHTINRSLERKKLLEIVAFGKGKSHLDLLKKEAFRAIITLSDKMTRLLREAELHAGSDVPVLITGESGTGKELLSRAIHQCSARSNYPFMSINMASLVGSLFDAEFFGHTKGAFTGAERDRAGYLESSHRGTLFLDEIGDLPYDFQGKLLRVLQDGEFMKIGTSKARQVDVRFIAATNADLSRLMAKEGFRKDLYYRLKGAWLHIPPLRERKEDIPLLVNAFLDEFRPVSGMAQIDGDALSSLMAYDYPGNVRELRSILQAAVNLTEGKPLMRRHLPAHLHKRRVAWREGTLSVGDQAVTLDDAGREHILRAYERTGKNKVRTARLLGIGLNTLRRKLAAYGID